MLRVGSIAKIRQWVLLHGETILGEEVVAAEAAVVVEVEVVLPRPAMLEHQLETASRSLESHRLSFQFSAHSQIDCVANR